MGKLLVIIFLLIGGGTSLFYPYLGVTLAYTISILCPQTIWPWWFSGIRPFYYIAIPTLFGFFVYLLKGKTNVHLMKTKISICLAIILIFVIISYLFGPYISAPHTHFDPHAIFVQLLKIYLFYFVVVSLVDNPGKLKLLCLPIIVSTLYMIYWANDQYLSHAYWGRLHGPSPPGGGGNYKDENAFAMLFVTGLPFIYFLGHYLKNRVLKYAFWLTIPLGWHAVFLTGSRGGFLGLVAITLATALRSSKKLIGINFILLLLIAYVWQGGSILKSRVKTIETYKQESSAETRLQAWSAALKMIQAHPIFGVGLVSFIPAFPDFSDKQPRVAHNTFLQLSAESGLIAGLCLVIIFIIIFKNTHKNPWKKLKDLDRDYLFMYLLNEALFVSLFGFVVCAMFLSLDKYEIMFYLFALANNCIYLSSEDKLQPETYVSTPNKL